MTAGRRIAPVVLCLAALAPAARAAGTEARVAALLAEAIADPTAKDAAAKVAQAEKTLADAGNTLASTERGFLAADVLQTRGRVALARWRQDQGRRELRTEARRSLLRALDAYNRFTKVWEDKAEIIEQGPSGSQRDHDLARAGSYISRASYAMAWTEYSLALAPEDDDERTSYLESAAERFVEVSGEEYRKHPIVADCFFGRALCLHELGRHDEVAAVLEQAKPQLTPPALYQRMVYLLVKTRLAGGKPAEAAATASGYFQTRRAGTKPGALELQLAIEWARSIAAAAGKQPDKRQQWSKQLDAVRSLIAPYGEPWKTEFARACGQSGAATPLGALAKARDDFRARNYQQALDAADAGLRAATAGTRPDTLADLRHTRFAACWNLRRWRDAHRAAADFLRRHPRDRRAADLCRIAFSAALKARDADPALEDTEFLKFLDFAERQFPDSPDSKRAAWYRATILLEAGKYAEAEPVLENVPVASPVYSLAQYGLALAAHRQAEAAAEAKPPDVAAEARHRGRGVEAVLRFIKATADAEKLSPDESHAAGAVVGIAVAAARGLLARPTPDHERAVDLLGRVGRWKHAGDRAAEERQALRIQACIAMGSFDGAIELIDAALGRDDHGPHLAHAFATIVDPLERQCERFEQAGKTDDAARFARRLVDIYTRLLRHVGKREAQQISVRRRLARNLVRIGHYEPALPHFEWLLRRVPQEKAGDVLRGAALAREHAGNHKAATEAWSLLGRGLEPKSEPWLEARYHLIACYHASGQTDHAARLMAFFRLQCPTVDSATWRAKFDDLERKLKEGDAAAR